MVATPYKLNVTMKRRRDGATQREVVTMNDVTENYGSVKSTANNFATIRGEKGEVVDIIDMSVNQAGVDTSLINIWVSGKDTGENFENASLVNTINNRLPGGVPLRAGSTIQFKQLT